MVSDVLPEDHDEGGRVTCERGVEAMSLVERLRAKDDPTCNAAAHEIEELRDTIARLGQKVENAEREARFETELNKVYRNDLSDARETIALLEEQALLKEHQK